MESIEHAAPLRYKGYIPGLDVLRGLAILAVLVYHGTDGRVPWQDCTTWLRWPLFIAQYGASGVQLFFILSGFLITSILLDTAGRPNYYRNFYVRRALRILPAYLLLLVVLRVSHVVSWRFVLAAILYIANMAGLVGARSSEYGSLWSLAVEEQFYLIWPLIVRRLSLKTLTHCIVAWLVFALLLRLAVLVILPGMDVTFKLWFNADWLLAGALIAICLRRNLLRRDNIDRLIRICLTIAVVTMPLSLFVALQQTFPVWVRALAALVLYPQNFAFAAALLVVLKYNQGPDGGGRKAGGRSGLSLGLGPGLGPGLASGLAFFGYISYGLYLVHPLVFSVVDRLTRNHWLGRYVNSPASLLLNTTIGVAISVLISYLSRRYFEDVFLRRKDVVVPYKDPSVNEFPEKAPGA